MVWVCLIGDGVPIHLQTAPPTWATRAGLVLPFVAKRDPLVTEEACFNRESRSLGHERKKVTNIPCSSSPRFSPLLVSRGHLKSSRWLRQLPFHPPCPPGFPLYGRARATGQWPGAAPLASLGGARLLGGSPSVADHLQVTCCETRSSTSKRNRSMSILFFSKNSPWMSFGTAVACRGVPYARSGTCSPILRPDRTSHRWRPPRAPGSSSSRSMRLGQRGSTDRPTSGRSPPVF